MADTATATGNAPTTIREAAAQFESLLSDNIGTQEEPKKDEAETKAEPEEGDAAEVKEETAETSPEGEAEETETTADGEDTEEQAEAKPVTVTVKVNGKTEEISLDEAAKGYQRQADYSQKTAAVAEERKALEAERRAVLEERATYAQLLPALRSQMESDAKEPDWQTLYDENPLNYVRQRDLWREKQERIAATRAEEQRLQVENAQERQRAIADTVKNGRAKLVEANPEWKDPLKWDDARAKILSYGKTIGFTDEELGATYDPRAVIALNKARLYDDLMAKKPTEAPKKGPASAPAGAAGSVSTRSTSETTKAAQRLAKTGKITDAASFFERIL